MKRTEDGRHAEVGGGRKNYKKQQRTQKDTSRYLNQPATIQQQANNTLKKALK
jgi:hypothetical protein